MAGPPADVPDILDVVIVGAGLSGINAAYRIQTELPSSTYAILEARGAIGGTWDLFRYPGVRSDSSMHVFGFFWRPWKDAKTIADGSEIRKYIQDSAAAHGIDSNVRFHHTLISAEWSSDQQMWKLKVDFNGKEHAISGRFVFLSTGYYDYSEALSTSIPGIEKFQGMVVHPQFWPEDFDYTNKRLVVIGSGATAVTLMPALAKDASHVTMVQRTPTYIASQPSIDPKKAWLSQSFLRLPWWLIYRIVRSSSLILTYLFNRYCDRNPAAARRLLLDKAAKQLPPTLPVEPHFAPKYNPWEQRLCVSPDGDFFEALRTQKAHVVTGTIKNVVRDGIKISPAPGSSALDEVMVHADAIITATGLKIQMAGGAEFWVDGQSVDFGQRFLWKGALLQDVPNLAVALGYPNAPWTLGADATAIHVCRILKHMAKESMAVVIPRMESTEGLRLVPVLDLKSTYVQVGGKAFPRCGDKGPWRPRSNYLWDFCEASWGSLKNGLEFLKVAV